MLHKECGGEMREERKQNSSRSKSRQYRKHPIGQRLIVGLLCICLPLVSLPIERYGYLALAAQRQEIVMFPALSSEVRTQTVEAGTEREELELPNTLSAVCRQIEEETPDTIQLETVDTTKAAGSEQVLEMQAQTPENTSEDASVSEESVSTQEPPIPNEPSISEEPELPVVPEEPEPPVVPEEPELPAVPEEPVPPAEPTVPDVHPEQNQTETVTIQGITWTSDPVYDGKTEGLYAFTPVLPLNYSLAAGVELPAKKQKTGDRKNAANKQKRSKQGKIRKAKQN